MSLRDENNNHEPLRLTLEEESALAGNNALIESLIGYIRLEHLYPEDYRNNLLHGFEAMHARNVRALSRLSGALFPDTAAA